MNIYELRDTAVKSGRAVFTAQQFAALIGRPRPIALVYLSRMVKKKLAIRVLRGYVSFSDDDLIIATQLVEPSYITAVSALNMHGLIQQVPGSIGCATTRNSRRYPKMGISYHRIPPSLFFGYARQGKGSSYMMLAEPEKALIDAVYLNLLPTGAARELLKSVDAAKLRGYLSRFEGRGKKKLKRCFM